MWRCLFITTQIDLGQSQEFVTAGRDILYIARKYSFRVKSPIEQMVCILHENEQRVTPLMPDLLQFATRESIVVWNSQRQVELTFAHLVDSCLQVDRYRTGIGGLEQVGIGGMGAGLGEGVRVLIAIRVSHPASVLQERQSIQFLDFLIAQPCCRKAQTALVPKT